jgi:ElaB/YqjD/DUF883 family membrane-anchored ribosome-binding protein
MNAESGIENRNENVNTSNQMASNDLATTQNKVHERVKENAGEIVGSASEAISEATEAANIINNDVTERVRQAVENGAGQEASALPTINEEDDEGHESFREKVSEVLHSAKDRVNASAAWVTLKVHEAVTPSEHKPEKRMPSRKVPDIHDVAVQPEDSKSL